MFFPTTILPYNRTASHMVCRKEAHKKLFCVSERSIKQKAAMYVRNYEEATFFKDSLLFGSQQVKDSTHAVVFTLFYIFPHKKIYVWVHARIMKTLE